MSDTVDFSVTIKGIPAEKLNNVWNDFITITMREEGFVLEKTNNISIDFDIMMAIDIEAFFDIVAPAISFHAAEAHNKYSKK